MKKAIQFGAGNIGRGFIGCLLSKAGYHVVFADVAQVVIDEINIKKTYTIHVKDVELEDIKIEDISGVNSATDAIFDEIEEAEIITTAVGPLVLEKIAPSIRKGIERRMNSKNENCLNIIACENAVYASNILKEAVYKDAEKELADYMDKYVGFPNCSVDRIVPPAKNEEMLDVTVEKFYEWNVEKSGFKGEIPEIDGMNLADNLIAYIERKLFTLNTGHAICAYLGSLKGLETIDKSIADAEIEKIVRGAMQESGLALVEKFGFKKEDHFKYIEKILNRFKNPYLNDDVKRVGREPLRKLSANDRLIKPLSTALEYGIDAENLQTGVAAALNYENPEDAQAKELNEKIESLGIETAIKEVTGLQDEKVIGEIVEKYSKLKK